MSRGRTAVVVEMVEVRRARREAEHSAGSHGPGGRRGNAKGGEERGLRVVVARWWLAGLRRRESRRGGEEEARGARRGVGRAGESETLLEPRERPCCFGGLVVWGPCPCCFGLTFPRSIYSERRRPNLRAPSTIHGSISLLILSKITEVRAKRCSKD